MSQPAEFAELLSPPTIGPLAQTAVRKPLAEMFQQAACVVNSLLPRLADV